ncbi:hypothetical protein QFC20_002901 [Naganishia adeliensis]|uniref:Uncharacterized protein n=1 Tax=Naganishia adeliensis TaxID=92952 RepID=A0ACC2WFY4_9TREE|nr:hypothetical protein QFC20_002901 [Naganishia adeliensis]
MPLQLLNIGSLFWIGVYRTFFRLTPRELVELYAPPSVNYGMIYPPAILVFIFTLTDSVISPLILIFGALYFTVGYIVYKYKLIYVFVNPYESTGEAWPTTFARLVWGIVLFELFMLGLFAARQSWYAATGLVPLLLGTIAWSWNVREDCKGLSRHTPLATIAAAEAERGGHERPISIRYSKKDHSMYRQIELAERLPKPWIAAELVRTDG